MTGDYYSDENYKNPDRKAPALFANDHRSANTTFVRRAWLGAARPRTVGPRRRDETSRTNAEIFSQCGRSARLSQPRTRPLARPRRIRSGQSAGFGLRARPLYRPR